MKWPCRGTIQCSMALKTNHLYMNEAYTVTFVEQPSFHYMDICEDNWYRQLEAQNNIKNMILPRMK